MADAPKHPSQWFDKTLSDEERERKDTSPMGRAADAAKPKRTGFLEPNDSLMMTQPAHRLDAAEMVKAELARNKSGVDKLSGKTAQPRDNDLDAPPTMKQLPALLPTPAVEVSGSGQAVRVLRLELPTAPYEIDERLVLKREPDSARAANYRVLRHRLSERGDPRTLVITSAEPKAGKSTVAANLALALSECGRAKVLLVEANFRHPQLGALFGFFPSACFHTQLTAHKDRPLDPWTTVELYSPTLQAIAVSPSLKSQPFDDGPAFAQALVRLRLGGYDYLVIDTPSVLGSADVNLVVAEADGVLVVARARHTRSRELRRAVEQLTPCKILGVALLDV